MKKTLSILLALLMAFTVVAPAFAEEGGRTVTFVGPSSSLITTNPAGEDIGTPYYFVKTVDGKPSFVEDPNGIYYLANDGYYHTAKELLETPEELAQMPTYSPEIFAVNTPVSITSGENLSFMVMTNEAYNAATANVYINDVKAQTNEQGEYVVYVDRDFTVRVNEESLLKSYFNVILTSGEGYSVKTLQGQNYSMVPYGGSFSFRVRIVKGFSGDPTVKVTRGTNELAEFLGEDADLLNKIIGSETLSSTGVDSEGCRIYTITNITSECKVSVSGIRETKKNDILTYFKRIIKMILDVFHIDTSFLGLEEVINLNYYTVNINENINYGRYGATTEVQKDKLLNYTLVTGTSNDDPFRMEQFNVMGGESVTVEVVTYSPEARDNLRVSWDPGNPNGGYSNVWTAKRNRATGETYYTTTFMIDNINATTNVNITLN